MQAGVCTRVCRVEGMRVCTLRLSVHTQPHRPSAGPRIPFPWEQRLPLPPAMCHCRAAAPKASACPRLMAEPWGQPPPQGCRFAGGLRTPCPWLQVPAWGGCLSPENETTSQSMGAELQHQ